MQATDWERFYREEFRAVCASVGRRMPVHLRQWLCPADLVQDAIAEVVASGRECANPWPLVVTIAHRRLIDEKRRRWRAAATALPIGLVRSAWPAEIESGDPGPADLAEAEDLRESLFAEASEDVRAIIRRRLEGYTMPEIARQEGCTVRTISRRMRQFRDQNRGVE